MSSNWYLHNKKKNINEMSQKFGISPLTSVILCNRNIYDDSDVKKILSSDISDTHDAKLLPDVDIACKILHEYINNKRNIRIIGDYDIDGVCATYILYDAIKNLGGVVSYDIPDRVADGYGINNSIIDKAISDKIELIITCDNGIAANEQIKYAKANNIDVIVTDHHDISELPKDAVAIVDPKRNDVVDPYPFEGICGAVVAFKFMERYYELYENNKDHIIDNYLEFAAIATIGDIMPLINENHIIAKIGLKKIAITKNIGLKKLLDVSGLDYQNKPISAYHVGFVIGPLINAAGRMDKATVALELFISNDLREIDKISTILKNLNEERKLLTENGTEIAIKQIEEKYKNDKVIVVYVESIGEQVAGIVAGRLKDRYNKPIIVLTDTIDKNEAKASCRSIEEYDIFNALNVHKDMFIKFGGHKLAAGFSIEKDNIDLLRQYLNEECNLTDEDFIAKMYIDVEFPFYKFDINLIKDLEKLEPYGQSFQKPTFATKSVNCIIKNVYGNEKSIVQLSLSKDNNTSKAVMFKDYIELKNRLENNSNIDIIYAPKVNEFRGNLSVDINILDYR